MVISKTWILSFCSRNTNAPNCARKSVLRAFFKEIGCCLGMCKVMRPACSPDFLPFIWGRLRQLQAHANCNLTQKRKILWGGGGFAPHGALYMAHCLQAEFPTLGVLGILVLPIAFLLCFRGRPDFPANTDVSAHVRQGYLLITAISREIVGRIAIFARILRIKGEYLRCSGRLTYRIHADF